MITLHHLDRSRSLRVLWLLEELGLPYDLVCHRREATMRAPDAMKALHPLGHAPIISDGDLVMFESGAIAEYIIHRYGQGRLAVPIHHADYAAYLTWLHAAEGTCMPALMPVLMAAMTGTDPAPAQAVTNRQVLHLCDDALAGREYFAGDFSAADIMMHSYLTLSAQFDAASFAAFDRLGAFLARVEQRPAYRRAVELTEPLAFASLARKGKVKNLSQSA